LLAPLTASAFKAAFTPGQHVARQQVARSGNMNMNFVDGNKQHVDGNMLPGNNMLPWCKRGLTD